MSYNTTSSATNTAADLPAQLAAIDQQLINAQAAADLKLSQFNSWKSMFDSASFVEKILNWGPLSENLTNLNRTKDLWEAAQKEVDMLKIQRSSIQQRINLQQTSDPGTGTAPALSNDPVIAAAQERYNAALEKYEASEAEFSSLDWWGQNIYPGKTRVNDAYKGLQEAQEYLQQVTASQQSMKIQAQTSAGNSRILLIAGIGLLAVVVLIVIVKKMRK